MNGYPLQNKHLKVTFKSPRTNHRHHGGLSSNSPYVRGDRRGKKGGRGRGARGSRGPSRRGKSAGGEDGPLPESEAEGSTHSSHDSSLPSQESHSNGDQSTRDKEVRKENVDASVEVRPSYASKAAAATKTSMKAKKPFATQPVASGKEEERERLSS